jgi:hypothetical protein
MPPTSREIREAERDFADILTDWCSISRGTSMNNAGDVSIAWSIVARCRCRIDAPTSGGGGETIFAERVADVANWVVTLPASVDIRDTDRVIIGNRILEVVGTDAPRSWQVGTRVAVIEVTP